jgi:VCBS repeat protein
MAIAIWLCIVAGQIGFLTRARAPLRQPGILWQHLSSANGDLPVPGKSREQTGAIVADLDKNGVNDFVLSFRQKAPALVWYRRNPRGWNRYVIEKEYLTVEAGGAVYDIDGDGYPDIVLGADYQGDQLWWWRNPGGHYDPDVSWERHTIKRGGSHQHHDQIFGDFKGTGKPQLVFWNQGAKKLFIADIATDPRHTDEWPMQEIYSGSAGEGPGKYAEGLAAIDVDGDGKIDLLAGNYWFKYEQGRGFRPTKIADVGGRIAAGRFIKCARHPQVVISSGDGVAPLKWYECRGDPEDPKSWIGHDLVGRDVIHGHSLQVADIDGDGNLDIFAAEMAKWTENRPDADNPNAEAWIFYGDGHGRFRRMVFSRGIDFHEARVADLNGDGLLDVLDKPYNWETPRVDIWLQVRPCPIGRCSESTGVK